MKTGTAERLCEIEVKCKCSKMVTEISDKKLKKKLLTKAELTFVEAEKMAVAAGRQLQPIGNGQRLQLQHQVNTQGCPQEGGCSQEVDGRP